MPKYGISKPKEEEASAMRWRRRSFVSSSFRTRGTPDRGPVEGDIHLTGAAKAHTRRTTEENLPEIKGGTDDRGVVPEGKTTGETAEIARAETEATAARLSTTRLP